MYEQIMTAVIPYTPHILGGTLITLFLFGFFSMLSSRTANRVNGDLRVKIADLKYKLDNVRRETYQELEKERELLTQQQETWERTQAEFRKKTREEIEGEIEEEYQERLDEVEEKEERLKTDLADWERRRKEWEEGVREELREELLPQLREEVTANFARKRPCKPCHGLGKIPSDYYTCELCSGSGSVKVWEESA